MGHGPDNNNNRFVLGHGRHFFLFFPAFQVQNYEFCSNQTLNRAYGLQLTFPWAMAPITTTIGLSSASEYNIKKNDFFLLFKFKYMNFVQIKPWNLWSSTHFSMGHGPDNNNNRFVLGHGRHFCGPNAFLGIVGHEDFLAPNRQVVRHGIFDEPHQLFVGFGRFYGTLSIQLNCN